jgi:dGTPase
LNLTFEVREGMVKHSRDFGPGEVPELDDYFPGFRPLLEAQLIDLADEIAYNTADLDDAFSADMLNLDDVASCVPESGPILEAVETQFPGATRREQFQECLRQLIDTLVSGLIAGTVEQARLAGADSVEDVRLFPSRLAAFTREAAELNRQLKALLHTKVYEAPLLTSGRSRSVAMVGELFQFFLAHPDQMPQSYRDTASQAPLHRMVCDYIAGMTDIFFHRIYQQHLGPDQIREGEKATPRPL